MRKKLFGILVLSILILGFNGIGNASLSDGLVAYYPFNGNANDESGNGNNGIVHGATLVADRFGNLNNAYDFHNNPSYRVPAQSYITIPNSQSLNPTLSISISVWIKTSDSRGWHIMGKAYGNSELDSFLLFYLSGGSPLRFEILTTSGANRCDTPIPILNEWHNIVSVWDGHLMQLYIDGIIVSTTVSNGTILYDNNPLLIGADDDDGDDIPDSGWNGVIDDIRIYNRALSASEIQEIYDGSAPPTCYDTGYTAGVAACKANPTSCGINVNPGTAVTLTPDLKMHLPNIQYNIPLLGSVSMWADLAYDSTKTDAGYFKVTGAGAN